MCICIQLILRCTDVDSLRVSCRKQGGRADLHTSGELAVGLADSGMCAHLP